MFQDVSTINEFARDFYARSLTIDSAFRQIFRSWLSDDVRSMFDSFEITSPVGETEIPELLRARFLFAFDKSFQYFDTWNIMGERV